MFCLNSNDNESDFNDLHANNVHDALNKLPIFKVKVDVSVDMLADSDSKGKKAKMKYYAEQVHLKGLTGLRETGVCLWDWKTMLWSSFQVEDIQVSDMTKDHRIV